MPDVDTVIIGAGMSGLAAGIRLALFESDVLILERHNVVGGLNSFYSIAGRKFDVGLHAMTNFVERGTRGAPLTKLLRQLRIPWEAFDLAPQNGSRIAFPGFDLCFTNDFSLFRSEVKRVFPSQINGFDRLTQTLDAMDETRLDRGETSARSELAAFISDPALIDTLLLPTCYYGSACENDMDFTQFAIMFRALFREGFSRPFEGVRQILRVLRERYRELGGKRRMKAGVRCILTKSGRAIGVELDSGEVITARRILSSAGWVETLRLCDDQPPNAAAHNVGTLAFMETISVLDCQPCEFGWDETIVFFNDTDSFEFQNPDRAFDPRSGVICLPNNYQYANGRQLEEGWLRVTALASNRLWHECYQTRHYDAEKTAASESLIQIALKYLPGEVQLNRLKKHLVTTDTFTPPTVTRFTGHPRGAIYGSPRKNKLGTTHLENLFICGTDQGYLGITGAMLSGISMANAHILAAR